MGEPSQIGASERWVVCATASARLAVVSADDDHALAQDEQEQSDLPAGSRLPRLAFRLSVPSTPGVLAARPERARVDAASRRSLRLRVERQSGAGTASDAGYGQPYPGAADARA
jgi:hypothetical protein